MVPAETSERGWTFRTLLTHIVGLIDANDKRYEQMFNSSQEAVLAALNAAQTAVNAALSAAEKAVAKAEAASEKRFDSVNEFRGTLADQQRTLMPRAEVELTIQAMQTQIDAVQGRLAEGRGRSQGGREVWGYIVGVAGLVAAGLSYVLHGGGKP